jgi:hypothetical protein
MTKLEQRNEASKAREGSARPRRTWLDSWIRLRAAAFLTMLLALACGNAQTTPAETTGEHSEASVVVDLARAAPGSLLRHSTTGQATTDRVRILQLNSDFRTSGGGHVGRLLTAHRNSDQKVKLVLWHLNDAGEISQIASVVDNATVTDFSISRIPPDHGDLEDGQNDMVVVAARGTDTNLRVTLWEIGNASVSFKSAVAGGAVTNVAVAAVYQEDSTEFPYVDDGEECCDEDEGPCDDDAQLCGDEDFAIPWRQIAVAVGVASQSGNLKLLPFLANVETGTLERMGGAGSGVSVNVQPSALEMVALQRPWGTVVTAARNTSDSKLALTTWSFDGDKWSASATDVVSAGTTVYGGTAQSVAVTWLSDHRIGVATQSANSDHIVSTWDISDGLVPSQRASKSWGTNSGPISIVGDSGTRLYSFGGGRIRSWEAVGDLVPLDYVPVSGISTSTSPRILDVANQRPDRPLAAWVDNQGTLKLSAFRNFDIPLLKGQWPKEGVGELVPNAPGEPIDDPQMQTAIISELGQEDLALAVGRKAVVMHDGGGTMVFYDRAGRRLPAKYCKAGTTSTPGNPCPAISTEVSLKSLIGAVLDGDLPNGSPNEQSLLRHLSKNKYCDPDVASSSHNDCTWGTYDGRAYYDKERGRFFIMVGVKNDVGREGAHQALAVSKSEDPRDGFWVYMSGEQKTTDAPRIGVAANMLLLGNSLVGGDLIPALHVFNTDALANPLDTNGAFRHVSTSKVPRSEVGKDWVRPVAQYGTMPYAIVFRYDPASNVKNFELFAIKPPWGPPIITNGPPSISPAVSVGSASYTLSEGMGVAGMPADAVVKADPLPALPGQYSGRLLFSAERDAGGTSLDVTAVKLPFRMSAGGFSGSAPETFFGPCPGRTGSAVVSCAHPAIAENQGKTVLSYVRYSPGTEDIFPTAQIDLLNSSDFSKIDTRNIKTGRARYPDFLDGPDTSAAAPDPIDNTLWVLQIFAGTSSIDVALGRVNP